MLMTCTCGKLLQTADNLEGKRVKCPQCGEFLQLLALGGGGRIDLWDLEAKALRYKDKADAGNPALGTRLLAFSPDGDLLVSVAEGFVSTMDVETGKVIRDTVSLNTSAQVAHVPGQ